MHDISFCDKVKRTPEGYALFIHHKGRTNALGARHGKPFWGYCPFDLQEIAYPFVFKGKTVYILNIGNLRSNGESAQKRLQKAVRNTDADQVRSETLLQQCEADDDATFLPVAKPLESFIISTAEMLKFSAEQAEHRAVK